LKTFNRLLSYFRYEKKLYISGILLSMISAGTSIYAPMIGKELIDYVSEQIAMNQTVELATLLQLFESSMTQSYYEPIFILILVTW